MPQAYEQKFSVFLPVLMKNQQQNLLFTFEVAEIQIR
jgi:hypothetical protein